MDAECCFQLVVAWFFLLSQTWRPAMLVLNKLAVGRIWVHNEVLVTAAEIQAVSVCAVLSAAT